MPWEWIIPVDRRLRLPSPPESTRDGTNSLPRSTFSDRGVERHHRSGLKVALTWLPNLIEGGRRIRNQMECAAPENVDRRLRRNLERIRAR